MIELSEVRSVFPTLTDIRPLPGTSGQKEVLSAQIDGQRVCLKIVKAYDGGDARTEREIQAVARLDSDYVPNVIEHGPIVLGGESRQFIIEPFIEGKTYREVLISCPTRSIKESLALLKVLLLACADFEAASLVHRDIKPENLMVGHDKKLWVLDFGLARHLDMTSLTLTAQHFGLGTPGYASPEQFQNLKPEIDSRADLYSIGMVAYEALAGSHPFLSQGLDPLGLIRKMASEDPPPLTVTGDHENALGYFVGQLLQRFPSRRPQSAAEALDWFAPVYSSLSGDSL